MEIQTIFDYLLNYGVLGFATGVSFFLLYKIFNHNIKEKKDSENKNDSLEKEFRDYILETTKRQQIIIISNTETMQKLADVIERFLLESKKNENKKPN